MNSKNSDSVNSEICTSQKQFICDVCKKNFFTKFHYQIHLVTHLLPEQFESCHECQEGSAHILSLDKHLEMHNNPACINSLNEHGKKHNSQSTNRFIAQQDTNDENIPTNNHNNEKHSPSDTLQNHFRCDRCRKEFFEKRHLDEHYQNHCIKKELNADEYNDFVPLSLGTTVFHPSNEDGVTSSQVLGKSKNIRIFTAKAHERQNEKTNARTQNSSKITQFVCEVCQKVFSNKYSLTIHFPIHSDHKTFKCRLCEKKFTLKSLLNAHLRTHKVKKVFCGVCQKGFDSKEKLFNHVYIHALVESFTCNICQMTFSEKSTLEKHQLGHIVEKEYTSEVQHGLKDRQQNFFKCDKCKKNFLGKDHLEAHYQNHCIKKELNSDQYVVPFPSVWRKILPKTELNIDQHTHSRDSLSEKPRLTEAEEKKSGRYFKCEVCQKKFYSRRTLIDHKHIHSGSFPYVCDMCSKGFARLDHLKRHYKTHFKASQTKVSVKKELNITKSTNLVSNSFVCDVCSKEFARRDHLERHHVVHTRVLPKKLSNEPSYFCDVCSNGFTRPDDLEDHYKIHKKQKPLKCETCGSNFRYKSNLTKHQLTHQQKESRKQNSSGNSSQQANTKKKRAKRESLHECPECSKVFSRPDHLKRHYLIHTGEKPFKCETCGARFNQKGTLTTHQLTHQRQTSRMLKSSDSSSHYVKMGKKSSKC